ncbi:MAG: MFS transporter [Eubacteriales bacterium]|nr:MFS transporter [Eubacteriales bacterium]
MKQKIRKSSKVIFWTLYLAYMSIYVARVNLSIAGPALKNTGILDSAQIGFLGSCFFVVYAVGRIVSGTLSDTVAPARMICTGLLLSAASNIAISFFPPYAVILCLWTLNAIGQSMLWSSVLWTVVSISEKKVEKKKTSLMVTSVATGNIAGILINSWLIGGGNPGPAFMVPGIISAVMAVCVFAAASHIGAAESNKPAETHTVSVTASGINTSEKTAGATSFADTKDPSDVPQKAHMSVFGLLGNSSVRTMGIVAMIHGVMKENISLWMAVYIVDTYLVDLTKSSYYILLIPVIGLIGRFLFPVLLSMFKNNENRVSLFGFLLCIAGSAVLLPGKTLMLLSVLALGLIYMAVSFINTSLLSIYPIAFKESGNTASVSGLMDFATYLGAGISSAVYGIVISSFGYIPMFVSWIVISVIAVLILMGKTIR